MRPASATDTVETGTQIDPLLHGTNQPKCDLPTTIAFRRPPSPAVPSHFEHAGAWRASRHPMRSRAGTIGLASDRRACAPPTDHAGVFFPTCDREADPCDAPSPIERCAPFALLRREESSRDRSRPPPPSAP